MTPTSSAAPSPLSVSLSYEPSKSGAVSNLAQDNGSQINPFPP
jgi:hypothetical protein